ncbi:flagellar biosynthesis protein FlgD [Yersinia mollaretii]|uniref:flagellar hook assembly protein FlgD n=1 Tax=Yersinia mollaretii TaxID=33060 RepID=UPI001427D35C|nr:flagellar hook capping FlgD N-terminal domain-containing protein [Yersinia mollaretii]MDA5535561.1 flagellar biosynthesis protein FlgD [Yersinia mollaretii]NIL03558.1 flagellar biosynthesis protein FlgD [Yersinia mollaretii]
MAVSPVMNSNNAAPKDGASNGSNPEDLTNSFMTLLVAQMQNQDPTNPMDNNQLTSQLAQFSTASGVQQLNSTVMAVGSLVTSMQQMNAADWVGRQVWIEGDSSVVNGTKKSENVGEGEGAEQGNQEFGFALDSDADKVTVTLTDELGNAYTAELKNVKAGVNKLTLDDLSNFQPSELPGNGAAYKVSFSAANDDGNTPKITSLKKAKVDGVSFSPTGAVLQLGLNGTASLGDIYFIE